MIGDSLRSAAVKLARVRRVSRAQYALDTDIGQRAIVKFMGRPMDERLRGAMAAWAREALEQEGHSGVTVEALFHGRLVEFRAHAEDKR
jgi:hypothetical protein